MSRGGADAWTLPRRWRSPRYGRSWDATRCEGCGAAGAELHDETGQYLCETCQAKLTLSGGV